MVNFHVIEIYIVSFLICLTCANMLNKNTTVYEKLMQEKFF